jgi:SAM-dependent methyltransferase
MESIALRSRQELETFLATEEAQLRRTYEQSVLDAWRSTGIEQPYWLPGRCGACQRTSTFVLDHQSAPHASDPRTFVPNWRERLVCAACGLNCRMRASLDLASALLPDPLALVWLTEQVTPVHRVLLERYPRLVGSEYLGDLTSGTIDDRGIRHEDIVRSSFADASLDCVASFDVLEHVPDASPAFAEVARVLRVGGLFFWTAPFIRTADATLTRARLREDGSVEHLLEPEYHGDPVSPDAGVLCFRHFGWDVLDRLREHGFTDVHVVAAWSRDDAVIGGEQLYFVARRAATGRRGFRIDRRRRASRLL